MTRDAVAGETPASSATWASVGTVTVVDSATVPVGDTRGTPFRATTPRRRGGGSAPKYQSELSACQEMYDDCVRARFQSAEVDATTRCFWPGRTCDGRHLMWCRN